MFLYWHRTSWLDVRSNLGCLPPSSWRFSTSLAMLGLRLPRHPLVHLPLQPLHLLSFSPNLLLQLPQLGILVQTHLACFFPKSRSWKQQKLWSRWMWESFKYTQLDPSSPLIAVETVETWEIPVLKLSLSCWSGSHVISWRDVLISLETLQQSKCNIKWWFWCILKNKMHFKPIFNNSPVRYDVKWNVD